MHRAHPLDVLDERATEPVAQIGIAGIAQRSFLFSGTPRHCASAAKDGASCGYDASRPLGRERRVSRAKSMGSARSALFSGVALDSLDRDPAAFAPLSPRVDP